MLTPDTTTTETPTVVDATRRCPAPRSRNVSRPSVGEAVALLDAYRVGDSLIATPTVTMLGEGVHTRVPHDERPLTQRIAQTLGEVSARSCVAPLVIGAVPFDRTRECSLIVPQTVRCVGPLSGDPLAAIPAPAASPQPMTVIQEPPGQEYAESVARSVRRIINGELAKVVLARTVRIDLNGDGAFDVPALVDRLARRDLDAYTFAVSIPGHGPGDVGGDEQNVTLLGSSPELLVARHGDVVVANPLAGSVPRSADLGEDVRRAAALLRSAKDLHEHDVVVHAVQDALAPFCDGLDVPASPTLVRTATMWHLSTTVTGRLRDAATTSLDLAMALHPTPAVCGTPTPTARAVIAQEEPVDRGFFTGVVGWMDAAGDGEWVVTIRCAQVGERSARLYAGAGVVAASDPQEETAETAAKMRTLLDAMGAAL